MELCFSKGRENHGSCTYMQYNLLKHDIHIAFQRQEALKTTRLMVFPVSSHADYIVLIFDYIYIPLFTRKINIFNN